MASARAAINVNSKAIEANKANFCISGSPGELTPRNSAHHARDINDLACSYDCGDDVDYAILQKSMVPIRKTRTGIARRYRSTAPRRCIGPRSAATPT